MADDRKALRRRVVEFVESRRPGWLDAHGAVIGITDRQRTLGVIPVGVRDAFTGEQVTKGTRFEIGSISKSFAAIVALQLVEEGLLDLHVPVTTYVPWFKVRSTHASITAHHLLTHTSGLIIGMDFADDALPAAWSLRGTSVGFAPGRHFHYSNDGYKLLGLVLEAVGDRPWPDMLRARILEPLRMTHTDPEITFDTAADIATPHQRAANDRPPHRQRMQVRAPISLSRTADGSIISTAKDMAIYARMLLHRGAPPGVRLLSDESFALMTTPHVADTDEEGVAYGYGLDIFEVDGRAHIGHAGGMVGHYALLWCDMHVGVAAAMMVNGHAEREPSVRFALDAARAHLAGRPLPAVTSAPDPLASPLAARLDGDYASADGATISLKDRAGRVVATTPDGEVTLEPLDSLWEADAGDEAGQHFAVAIPSMDRFALGVEADASGRVIALVHGPTRYVRAGTTLEPDPPSPAGASRMTGTYRTWNPWSPGFRVFVRAGRLILARPDGEWALTRLEGGEWRVGDEWSPDRVRFVTMVNGVAQQAIYNAVPYSRSFLD
ncbi:MAG: serine hydrolase domain-containing protein [Actinomycetota bacterium]